MRPHARSGFVASQRVGRPAVVALILGLATVTARGQTEISDPAYALLTERVAANQMLFFVYQDGDAGLNHGFPSGFFGDSPETLSKIHLDAFRIDDPTSPTGCSADLNRLDRQRGTVLRISFDPLAPLQFAGVNIEEPEHWGALRTGIGYDLSGVTSVVFDARSPVPGTHVQFGVGERVTTFLSIPQDRMSVSVPLDSLSPSPPDLTSVHVLFGVATNDVNAPNGATVLLDNIRFESVPSERQERTQLPARQCDFRGDTCRHGEPGPRGDPT